MHYFALDNLFSIERYVCMYIGIPIPMHLDEMWHANPKKSRTSVLFFWQKYHSNSFDEVFWWNHSSSCNNCQFILRDWKIVSLDSGGFITKRWHLTHQNRYVQNGIESIFKAGTLLDDTHTPTSIHMCIHLQILYMKDMYANTYMHICMYIHKYINIYVCMYHDVGECIYCVAN